MHQKSQKAFTLIELIFVIVIIGILAGVAIPKFAKTSILAHDAKATSILTSVMSAIATERQKRILQGDFTATGSITSLGTGKYVFSVFNADQNNNTNDVIAQYIDKCGIGDTGCWTRSGKTYTYTFIDAGTVVFTLDKNKLKPTDGNYSRLLK